jgi:uncharacterized protein (TIGR03086 family)
MMFMVCLQGCSKDVAVELVEAVDVLQPDPVTAFTDQVRALRKVFESPGTLDRICHHAVADMKGIHLLRARVFDVTLHAWDIAHTISADEQLDPRLTALALKLYEPFAAPLVASGHAASSIEISPDAPVQARLIALSGRRPWAKTFASAVESQAEQRLTQSEKARQVETEFLLLALAPR